MKGRPVCGPWAVTMRIKGWSEWEKPKEDRNPKELGGEEGQVGRRKEQEPQASLPAPLSRALTLHRDRHRLSLEPRVRSYWSAWSLQEGQGFSVGWGQPVHPPRPLSGMSHLPELTPQVFSDMQAFRGLPPPIPRALNARQGMARSSKASLLTL